MNLHKTLDTTTSINEAKREYTSRIQVEILNHIAETRNNAGIHKVRILEVVQRK
jgi:hypothetical protein